jgi:hypothetical protein
MPAALIREGASPQPGDLAARVNPAVLVVPASLAEQLVEWRAARGDLAEPLDPELGAQNPEASAVLVVLVAPESRVARVVLDGLAASVGSDREASMSVPVAWGSARWGLVTWPPAR